MEDHIKQHWETNAKKFKDNYTASWGDNFGIELEIDLISNYIKDGYEVLDCGCANGHASLLQWQRHKLNKLIGIDFSENMIEYANENLIKNQLEENKIKFDVQNILNLDFDNESFDLVYTTRVLINLPTWEQQKKAIDECLRVTKLGGIVILCEAFWEPLCRLNSMRMLAGLNPLVEQDFNRYIKKEKLQQFLTDKKLKFENIDFSSIYYLGSRFLRELVTDVNQYPGYSNPINRIFFDVQKEYSGGNFGIQQAYIIYKN